MSGEDISGVWSWETCTLTVATPGNCQLTARGDTGWKVEAEFKIDGDKIKHPCVSMKAVCQPLQADGPEVPQDGNMRIVSKLLRGLATINKEGSQLKLKTDKGQELCFENKN